MTGRLCHYAGSAVALALIAAVGIVRAEPLHAACFVEVPVYDAAGRRLPFRIAAVTVDRLESRDPLAPNNEFDMSVSGNRLYFSEGALRRGLHEVEMRLEDGRGARAETLITLTSCHQRASVEYGNSDHGVDAAGSRISGRLTGCRLAGDWWIRALPMFGQRPAGLYFDGYIRLADGSFWIDGGMCGERHLVVVGRDTQPIKAVGVNVVRGESNDAGLIDLSGLCPK